MLWRLASAWGDSPPRNSCTTWRLNSIECVRCLAMGFLLESPVQLADSQGPYLSTPKGALQNGGGRGPAFPGTNALRIVRAGCERYLIKEVGRLCWSPMTTPDA